MSHSNDILKAELAWPRSCCRTPPARLRRLPPTCVTRATMPGPKKLWILGCLSCHTAMSTDDCGDREEGEERTGGQAPNRILAAGTCHLPRERPT